MELALFTALPFCLALLLAAPIVRKTLNKSSQTIVSTLVLAALFAWLISALPRVQEAGAISQAIMWMPSVGISLSFYLDGLALLFSLIITGVGALIFFYAGFYFDDAEEHNRFIIWLSAFAGAMLAVVLSGNVLMMFVAWELTSITSFILIGFKGAEDAAAREGAFKALFVTGAGALALIVGLVMLSAAAGQILHPQQEIRFVADFASILQVKTLHQHEWYWLFTALILLGGFTKSAQFPFHFWLPGAMSAPTPASAYLHSATMVKAGIYLFARLSPVMHANDLWTVSLLTVGLATMLVGACFAVKQRDLKGLLAYSTVSKLGAIVAMIGLPNQSGLKAAFVGIIAHALYKSALFLVAGTIDHATGARAIERLGGLRSKMPVLFWVTVVSALSMAGFPFLLGFLAKETLLDAMLRYSPSTQLAMIVVIVSAAFTAMAGYMLIYDVFLGHARERLHFHQPSPWITLGPALLALGSLCLGFLLEPILIPLLELALPKSFELQLFAGFNEVFFLSAAILLVGLLLFFLRKTVIKRIVFPISGDAVFREFITYVEWAGTSILHSQSGFVRYYLAIILGAVASVLIGSGVLFGAVAGQQFMQNLPPLTITDLAKAFMLFLTVAAGLLTVVVREHVKAAIAYGLIGYAIGVIFLINHAPDVALVQLLVETMATVLIIIMLGRIRADARLKVINSLWTGRHKHRIGLLRDLGISIVIGVAVFVFSLIALQNRPVRHSIAEWHLANAKAVNTDDVVGAIVADFRGTDTLLEVAVFTTAALGVLTLLARGRRRGGLLAAPLQTQGNASPVFEATAVDEIQDATSLSTPFTRSVSFIVLPIAVLIGVAQVLYGGSGPGDGFTAGVTIGLAVSLWYVVLGYNEAKKLLPWFRPALIVRLGLLIAIANALFPLLIGKGFMGHVEFDQALGIYDIVGSFGLHITSSLIFEIAIAIAVTGGLGIIIEAIAYPSDPAQEQAEAPIAERR